jgi:D-glycero-D-manno-heptose 1,7-bisphosphate phosphatase
MTDRRAAFLDRDGTLMEDRHYLSDPDGVRLVPGAAAAVRQLRMAAISVVVVTNQSGIALGLITEQEYEATRDRLAQLMAAEGADLDLQLHCPHHPTVSGPCGCRKPAVELYERGAKLLGADLTSSLFVGDRWRDVAPGLGFGGRAFLVPSHATPTIERDRAERDGVLAPTLGDAVARFLAGV